MDTKFIARVNGVDIVATSDEEQLVPIKPICEALGIDFKVQYEKLREDEDLSSTMVLSTIVAKDDKEREMCCLPIEFVFGWLFTINPKNVKPEAKEAVRAYRWECYRVLYRHFTQQAKFMKQKDMLIDRQLTAISEAKQNFNNAKNILRAAEEKLKEIRAYTFEDYVGGDGQLRMFD